MIKTFVSRNFSRLLTSPDVQAWRHAVAALPRRIRGAMPVVHYFHQVDDPYSQLTAELLPAFCVRYRVQLQPHLVPPPADAAAPDRERLQAWSRRDASRLATGLGLGFSGFAAVPAAERVRAVQQQLARALAQGRFVEMAAPMGRVLWSPPAEAAAPAGISDDAGLAEALRTGAALRERLGHYLGATFFFEGAWYWGVDRLHFLEQRLAAAGLQASPAARPVALAPLAPAPALQWLDIPRVARAPELHFYCSFRSPYTYLAVPQVRRLAAHYGADLKLRFVLPMVMRGLPVPFSKRLYIMRDTKREAERLGLRFGDVADPVGRPVERGLAVLHHAIARGHGPALAESFLQGVFADGIDAGSDAGLHQIGQRAGLTAAEVVDALRDDAWRAVAEANRQEMLALGVWGVPSFRIDDRPALWGQDRLWMVEQDLIEALRTQGAAAV